MWKSQSGQGETPNSPRCAGEGLSNFLRKIRTLAVAVITCYGNGKCQTVPVIFAEKVGFFADVVLKKPEYRKTLPNYLVKYTKPLWVSSTFKWKYWNQSQEEDTPCREK